MPEITSCPECEKKLRVPDDLIGKKVRCPGCSVMFIAQAGAGLPEETPKAAARAPASRNETFSERRSSSGSARDEDDDERPRARRRQEEDERDEEERPRTRRRQEEEDEEERRPRPRGDERIRSRPDDEDDRRRRIRRDEDEDYPDRRRDEDDEDHDVRDRPRGAAKGWRGVRMGLTLVMIAAWAALAMIGVGAIGVGILLLTGATLLQSIFNAAPNQQAGTAAGGAVAMGIGLLLFFLVLGAMALAELILRLTGYGMCMQVPASRRNAARGLAIASFACAAGAVLLNCIGAGMNGFGGVASGGMALAMAGSSNALSILVNLVTLAGFICWLIFLRSVALELRGPEVAQRVVQYIITVLVFGAVAFILCIVIGVVIGVSIVGGGLGALGAAGVFAFLVGGLLVLGSVGLYVWYVLIVTQVRGLVDRHLARM